MNTLDKQYLDLLQDILDNGVIKQDRTSTGTLSVFGRTIRHKMSEGFPLLTTKKMPFKLIATELLWFLRGDTNIKFLVDNDCNIWNGDAYKNYISKTNEYKGDWPDTIEEFIKRIKTDDEFAKKWGDLGPIYGKQWRHWTVSINDELDPNRKIPGGYRYSNGEYTETYIDQISTLINDLKTNPDSRRLMVNAWNVGELDQMVLPPCHYGFQVYTRKTTREEKITNPGKYRAISLMWNQRSVDTFLGLPFNIASYGLLLEIIAKAVNMVPDELIGNLGDTHLYLNHIEQAKEQIGRELTLDERRAMVNQEMFNQIYNSGDSSTLSHSEIDQWNIPRFKIREPYALPTLNHMKTCDFYKSLSEDLSLITHFDASDFVLENYQSHPTIKAPLSN
jgi:thymidylate synthase